MKRFSSLLLFFLLIPLVSANPDEPVILRIRLDGTINPAAAEFIQNAIKKATEQKSECLILELNTPGGLLKSTRVIVSEILASEVPIIVYVSPAGSQSASAGVFITLAAHIAAMAPGTNIGAAHPVSLQGQQDSTMIEKATNDAAAFIRTIAEKRNRNLQWAEEAVRQSKSITETEALNRNVIDLIVKNVDSLLVAVDGKELEVASGKRILHTRGASIQTLEMNTAEKILDILSDPNIAYILFMLGIYGLLFELYNPGSILPGVVGFISIVLAFYALHTLPINYAGLALIIFAVILFIAEIKVVSHGLLTVGGIISLLLGSMMLIRVESALEFVELSWSVILTTSAITAIFFLIVITLGLRVQAKKPTTGIEGLLGEIGLTISSLSPEGMVRVHGEIWQAESNGESIGKNQRIRVVEIQNLKLIVEKVK